MPLPTNNGTSQPCTAISSNCIIWQGPNLPCINLCKGDTISDVVAKLAEELCALIDAACVCEPDLAGLDLKCTLPEGDPTPATIEAVIQLIVDYICSLEPLVYTLPIIALPLCLQYNDPLGNPVTALRLDLYAALLANKICVITGQINVINVTLLNHETRLTTLEDCVLPCTPESPNEPLVMPQCVLPASLVDLSTLTLALELAFCSLSNAVGTTTQIANAISQQCLFSTTSTLSTTSTYGVQTGWQSTASTVAQSMQNMWIVICDLYAALKNVQDNCCPGGCDAVVFGYTYSTVVDGGGIVTDLVLNFTSSTIPAPFADCGGSTVIKVTDSNGAFITVNANIAALQTNPLGLTIDISSLNTTSAVTVYIAYCATDGVSNCSEINTQIIPLQIPCPTGVTLSPSITSTTINFTNALGTSAIYTIVVTNNVTSVVTGSAIVINPGPTVSSTISGLAGTTLYDVTITVQYGGSSIVCPSGSFTTLPASPFWVVRDCLTSASFIVDTGLTIVTPGGFYNLTNTGASYPGWTTGDTKCVEIISASSGPVNVIASVDDGPHLTCGCSAELYLYEVEDCVTLTNFNVESLNGLVPLSMLDTLKMTNTGGAIVGWALNEVKCVTVIGTALSSVVSVVEGAGYGSSDCPSCLAAL